MLLGQMDRKMRMLRWHSYHIRRAIWAVTQPRPVHLTQAFRFGFNLVNRGQTWILPRVQEAFRRCRFDKMWKGENLVMISLRDIPTAVPIVVHIYNTLRGQEMESSGSILKNDILLIRASDLSLDVSYSTSSTNVTTIPLDTRGF